MPRSLAAQDHEKRASRLVANANAGPFVLGEATEECGNAAFL
jgi:hypothetical protein